MSSTPPKTPRPIKKPPRSSRCYTISSTSNSLSPDASSTSSSGTSSNAHPNKAAKFSISAPSKQNEYDVECFGTDFLLKQAGEIGNRTRAQYSDALHIQQGIARMVDRENRRTDEALRKKQEAEWQKMEGKKRTK